MDPKGVDYVHALILIEDVYSTAEQLGLAQDEAAAKALGGTEHVVKRSE